MNHLLLKLKKLVTSIVDHRRWPALFVGVAPSLEHRVALCPLNLKTIVDVGANRGQFSLFCHLFFPQASIYAFEPLSQPARICSRIMREHTRFVLHQVAIGADKGTANIFVTDKSDSSSLLKPGLRQSEIFHSYVKQVQEIRVEPLFDVLERREVHGPALLKIDVQGYELSVLEGCGDDLGLFDFIYVELSFIELYEKQAIAGDVIPRLAARGFRLVGVFNEYIGPEGRPVQADFLFQRDMTGK